ncbi:hypothetical protein [Pararhodobacter aggregans]|uniref:hypothetical protein n=1 Tax=Pararhodobacter aggregans TaxID=404875 RepID=UPI00105782E9|nr:hypothetical protein [Pararhodobacter aggregans]
MRALRQAKIGALLVLLSAGAAAAGTPPPAGGLWQQFLSQIPHPRPASCCRICTRGNACISRNRRCHQPPGCACDG